MARTTKPPVAVELRDLRRWADAEFLQLRCDTDLFQQQLRHELNRLAAQVGVELPKAKRS